MEPQGERPQLQSVRTAVVGASGYSGQELLHYLARHPVFGLRLVTSRQNAGRPLSHFVHGLPRQLGELILIPGLVVLASAVGYLPALSAYRTDVAKSLITTP